MTDPTVIFQAPNRIGLGHMHRLANIAEDLRLISPAVSTPFVIEGEAHGVLDGRHCPSVALPSMHEMNSSRWNWLTPARREQMVEAMSMAILDTLKPALTVFDCFPSQPFLTCCLRLQTPFCLCVRKVRDFEVYRSNVAVRLGLEHAKLLFVPHFKEDFLLPEEYEAKVRYTGPIARRLPISPTPVSLELGAMDKKVIVITGGGGGHRDIVQFYNLGLKAVSIANEHRAIDAVCLLLTGPLFGRWKELIPSPGVRMYPSHPAPLEVFATADLVIAQGGYNSLAELAALGTPTICVPADTGYDDQVERIAWYTHRTSSMKHYTGRSPEKLAAMIAEVLNSRTPRERSAVPPGARVAAEAIFDLCLDLQEESSPSYV